ncbi:MAG: hypothetical protein L0Y71_18015 [Gemmataceae bacterium]|nr:hypothetical protein [Gemmataceae bacterium]
MKDGGNASKLDPLVDTGTLYFNVKANLSGPANKRKAWVAESSSAWKFVMLGKEKIDAEGVAKALLESVGGTPWRIRLPKKIRLSVIDESMHVIGDSNKAKAWLVFKAGNTSRHPDAVEDLRGSKALLDEAWSYSVVRQAPINNDEVEGDINLPYWGP